MVKSKITMTTTKTMIKVFSFPSKISSLSKCRKGILSQLSLTRYVPSIVPTLHSMYNSCYHHNAKKKLFTVDRR